jgi:ActR/RegA family two-component response regulator
MSNSKNKTELAEKARRLSARRISDPKAFVVECRDEVKKSKGNVSQAAEKLGVSRRTLTRYIAEFPAIMEGVRE